MNKWKVDTKALVSSSSDLKNSVNQLKKISDGLEKQKNLSYLSFDGNELLQKRIDALSDEIFRYVDKMQRMENVLENISSIYQKTEQQILAQEAGVSIVLSEKDIEDENYIGGLIKKLLKFTSKVSDDKNLGAISALFSYLYSLYNFGDSSLNGKTFGEGFADWCDIGKNSSGILSAIYKWYKNDLTQKNTWNEIEGIKLGKKVAGVSVASSILGLIGKIVEASNKKNTTTMGRIADGLDASTGITDLVKSLYELKNFEKLSKIQSGIHSTAGKWVVLCDTTLSFFGQTIRSADKYYADGVWDMGDTGKTGVEASIKGLDSLASGLTFGLVSLETFGTSAEETSKAMENFAEGIGEWIGKKIIAAKNK